MTLNIALDRVIPLTEARARLSEIVEQTSGDQFWVLTRRGRPRVAVVDVEYLDQLIRQAWFNDLASRSQTVFDEYLRRRGLDPAMVTEEEVRAWQDGHFEIVVNSETLAELEHTLWEKVAEFGAEPVLAEEWAIYVRTFARIAPATTAISGVCRDPDDDKFLDAALGSGATAIVSGDHDLQALGEYQNVKVLSPREFAEWLGIVPPPASSGET
jgi:putative PIN family toxin of toxin-antitoxin system